MRLILLRHAKAGPKTGDDIDRPLAPRGREAAARMGAYLRDEGLLPELALVSDSRRTRETWDLVQPFLGDAQARFERRIYEALPARLLTVVREVEPSVRTVLMIGHNPGFHELAQRLVGGGDGDAVAELQQKFPTAAVAVIDFDVDAWADVDAGGGRLDRFVTPKSLGAGEDD